MVNWSNRIDLSDDVAALLSSCRYDDLVEFVYIHNSGRECSFNLPLNEAILLAERRMSDRRYRNYTIYIC